MEVEEEEEREEKQNQRTERLMELTQREMEGKDLQIINHPSHDHSRLLREPLQGGSSYRGGSVQVYCDGCRELISSTSSSSSSTGVGGGGGAFYDCPNSDCWFLLHKQCAELPLKIEHPSHPDHALTLSPFRLLGNRCNVCYAKIDSFLYRCSDCDFDVHVRCASMALRIQDRVNENKKIHQHPLIPIEMEAQFLCAACGREHKGKSYLCPTCGFWANQICASAPTTVDLHSHPHLLTLFRSFRDDDRICEICYEDLKRAYWGYRCSEECRYWVHVGCWLSLEEAENSNKDIQTNLHSGEHFSPGDILRDPQKEVKHITWPMSDESIPIITQLIKSLILQRTHERATKILHCRVDHPLKFVEKIDESRNDQVCDGCGQIISSQFFHCTQCNFSLHEWCAELPNELQHILHQEHRLCLITPQEDMYLPHTYCHICYMPTNGFVFGCTIDNFCLDLKCALLPRLIKHQVHDHDLALRMVTNTYSCNACGVDCFLLCTIFRCEACNFGLCIKCALLPFSVRHRYDKHPFSLTYSPIKGQPDDYYCEICEEEINSVHWFYHCIECDQSLHPKCIYPIERCWNMKFGGHVKMNFHSHFLSCVRRPKEGVLAPCHDCGCHFGELDYMAYECEQCDFWMHGDCLYPLLSTCEQTSSSTPPK